MNYLASGDAELLGRSRSSVVHCPTSHDYFGHRPFPLGELQKAGVNICLGTDSLASSARISGRDPELSLWEEMRVFANKHSVRPARIFEMVTTHAAGALGKEKEAGQVGAGFQCDLAAATYTGPISEVTLYETLMYDSQVREVIVSGEIVSSKAA